MTPVTSIKRKRMNKTVMIGVGVMLLLAVWAWAGTVIEIDVSPNVLNIGSSGEVVTVHTDIPYGLVTGASVELNGIEIDWWKSDNRGYFVAKFVMEDVKASDLCIGEYNTLTVSGTSVDGDFSGSQEIKVINVKPGAGAIFLDSKLEGFILAPLSKEIRWQRRNDAAVQTSKSKQSCAFFEAKTWKRSAARWAVPCTN